jgi:hypothetical protein
MSFPFLSGKTAAIKHCCQDQRVGDGVAAVAIAGPASGG